MVCAQFCGNKHGIGTAYGEVYVGGIGRYYSIVEMQSE
jgi:hypothetical protein